MVPLDAVGERRSMNVNKEVLQMDEEITLEHEGAQYTASYNVFGDTLTVYLPNGEARSTELRGLGAESAAMVHLKSYVLVLTGKKN